MEPKVAETTPPRVPLDVEVEFKSQGPASSTFQSMNLSEGGIFIKSPFPLDPSSPVTCSFRLPDEGPPVNVTGEVAWIRTGPPEQIPPPGMGIRFDEIDENTAERIRKHVALMERDLLWEENQESLGEADTPTQDLENHFLEQPPAESSAGLILEGDLLLVTDADGRKYTARVKQLTPEGITLEMPMEETIQDPGHIQSITDICSEGDNYPEFPLFPELSPPADLNLAPPPPSDATLDQQPQKNPASPPLFDQQVETGNRAHSEAQEPATGEFDSFEEPEWITPQYKEESIAIKERLAAEEPVHSPPRVRRVLKHSGMVDFKGRVSKDPLRRSRSQKKSGSGKKLILCTLPLIVLGCAAALYFWKTAEKDPIEKGKQPEKTEKTISLDSHAVELPSPDKTAGNVSNPGPLNPENTLGEGTEKEPAEGAQIEKADVSSPANKKEQSNKPVIARDGGLNRLTLPTNKKPDKITHYWMADPPGIVVDLHGVQPGLEPGRYDLEQKGARLLRVTGNESRTRFIVYFHPTVPRERVEVKKTKGGGSVTWLEKSSGRRLSQRKTRQKGKSEESPEKKISLVE